ncbi:MAG: FecR family protein [Bacteriovorax sp.]|jgi:hypothetical protein
MKFFILFLSPIFLLIPNFVFANSETIAEAIKLRGEITQLSPGARIARKVVSGDRFLEDTSIVTGPNSFIKIKFADSSEINVGPESKIVITEMKNDSVGIISLLKGKIRTEVQKVSKTNTNRFFIKTRTAAMGVRGTEFQTIYNPENKMTSLLTYKGEVAMAKVDEKTYERLENAPVKSVVRDELTNVPKVVETPAKKLDEVEELNKILKNKSTVIVPPGQNSVSSDSLKKTSLPVTISPLQLEALYKNEEFQEKDAANLNLKSGTGLIKTKQMLKIAPQAAPLEGMYNEKTGDFAPKAGGFIDLNTGLYIAPGTDSKLDNKSGVYVAEKVGDFDADTGQYVAPKGLVLDAKKGFVVADTADKQPELLAMKEDLNKNIAHDIVVGMEPEEKELAFNIDEKFIRDRVMFSVWFMDQTLKVNENSAAARFFELNSEDSYRFSLDWQMATNNRFSPIVGIDYGTVTYASKLANSVTQESKKLMGLSFGVQFALTKKVNIYSKFGLHQDHYLDQTVADPAFFNLKKVVLTRLSIGANAEFWRGRKYSLDASAGGLFTFRKRINNLIINEGAGLQIEVLPKYALSDKKWIGLGLKLENQFQKSSGSTGINHVQRNTSGVELKYISDF